MPFGAGSDDVYADMLAALKSGEVDAVVDDDVVFVPLGETHPDFELAFVVRTGNRWGSRVPKGTPRPWPSSTAPWAVYRGRPPQGCLAQWLPTLDYPFDDDVMR